MAMTCAWAMQADYDKVLLLIGEQSITGNNLEVGDTIGISVLNKNDIEIATLIGDTHSNDIDKIKKFNFVNYNGVYVLPNANVKVKCEVVEILHLKEIETDHLVYAKVLKVEELSKSNFLHMSDF